MDCNGCICFEAIKKYKLSKGLEVPLEVSDECVTMFKGVLYLINPKKCPCLLCIIKVVCGEPCEAYRSIDTGHLITTN